MPGLIDSMISTIQIPPSVMQRTQAAPARPEATPPQAAPDVAEISMAGRLALAREADSMPREGSSRENSNGGASLSYALPETGSTANSSQAAAAQESGASAEDAEESESRQGVAEGSDRPTATDGSPLSEAEVQQVQELQDRDRAVRAHEQAHAAAAGGLAMGGPTYHYQRGPDGRNYAVGGEVKIDSSPIPGDPEATIRKMDQVRRAALAPADPSPTDRSVASQADRQASLARMELLMQQAEARQQDNPRSNPAEDDAAVDGAQALQMNMALQALSPMIA